MPKAKKEKKLSKKNVNGLLEDWIKTGSVNKSCLDLNIKEKRRFIDDHIKQIHHNQRERLKAEKGEDYEAIIKLIEEAQKGTDLEGSGSLYTPAEKFHLIQEEVKRLDYERELRKKEEASGIVKKSPEFIWKDFYKEKSPQERCNLLNAELGRVVEKINLLRKAEYERLEKEEQEVNLRVRKMEEEGIWYGPIPHEKEDALIKRSEFLKAEKEAEIKRTGIIAEIEDIIRTEKLKRKPSDNKLH